MSRGQKNHKFMERLKQRRAELNLKQDELEELYNFGKGTISQYERGVRYPSDMASLAKALGVYEKWLSGESDFKDIEQVRSLFVNALSNSFKDSIDIFEKFISFSQVLGYTIELSSDNSHFLITTSKGGKKISPDSMNTIYKDIVKDVISRFDSLKADSINIDDTKNQPYVRIISSEDTSSTPQYDKAISQIIKNSKNSNKK